LIAKLGAVTQTLAAVHFGPVTLHAPRRRRRRRVTIVLVLLMAVASVAAVRRLLDDAHRNYLTSGGWPAQGQGAYQLGDQQPRASADEQPVPIASLAKVMTAYLVLRHLPLHDGDDGPEIVVTDADVVDTESRRGQEQSIVEVRAGERLTERDALMAVLLPSANNVAVMLARWVDTSVEAFVAEMNRTAHLLGMRDTTYTDPSGFDTGTVSTAIDQLNLGQLVSQDRTLAAMMAVPSYELPVGGTVHNTDTLLGNDGFVGMKTGSDDAAGGCFMFRSRRIVDGHAVDLTGVVLGQHGRHLVTAGLYAAKQLADRIAPTPAGN
jgi:D-alanyl-D-alanine carboxypeptidase (penicillin-binding protein 5/6)